jgi:hypothetical protein
VTPRDRPHIIVQQPARAEPYRRPPRRIEQRPVPRPDDRGAHGSSLASALRTAEASGRARKSAEEVVIEGALDGIYVVFESFPDLELALESLDPQRGRVHPELVSVRDLMVNGRRVSRATVFIPDGKLGYFLGRVEKYIQTSSRDKPSHSTLLDRVRSIGIASLAELWTDPPNTFPDAQEIVWWEVWLRQRDGEEIARLKAFAEAIDGTVGRQVLVFADRTVVLLRTSAAQLGRALDVLDDLAELRRPRIVAELIAAEPASTQAEWVDQLADRLEGPAKDAPAACIVDTGVHQAHPLLQASLDESDCHACDPVWGEGDHHGHGTEMAGLALMGDVGEAITSGGSIRLRHRLESVKLLPPPPGHNPPELYGAVTATAASLVEIQAPKRRRVFSMAVSAPWQIPPDDTTPPIVLGQPSSWSAAIDALAAGLTIDVTTDGLVFLDEDEEAARRLFLVAAGNVDELVDDHLARSDVEPIEDPGQAWNAVTIGAYTDLTSLDGAPADYDGWTSVAAAGELSPFSRTSVSFQKAWPLKPEVVFEGGNTARPPGEGAHDTPDVLSLLTTKAPGAGGRLLTVTRETSAATAMGANLAAELLAEYPALWPEAVRALMVHSAEWTPAMRYRFAGATTRAQKVALQRRYGMGVPDLARALHSATDALTLVVQDVIHPFDGEGRMREMHLHDLPWPTDVLADLGGADVRMRVTLSYFVEPNPGRRGWARRYTYASHGLRFDVRRPTESVLSFRERINALARNEEERRSTTGSDASEWFFGPDQRTAGSLHTDMWNGTAADLAERGMIAVYPVTGWWKLRKDRDHSDRGARYALIVSIETPEQDVDIWTPVAQELGIPVEIEIQP